VLPSREIFAIEKLPPLVRIALAGILIVIRRKHHRYEACKQYAREQQF
jgi:hypothetical protein